MKNENERRVMRKRKRRKDAGWWREKRELERRSSVKALAQQVVTDATIYV